MIHQYLEYMVQGVGVGFLSYCFLSLLGFGIRKAISLVNL